LRPKILANLDHHDNRRSSFLTRQSSHRPSTIRPPPARWQAVQYAAANVISVVPKTSFVEMCSGFFIYPLSFRLYPSKMIRPAEGIINRQK